MIKTLDELIEYQSYQIDDLELDQAALKAHIMSLNDGQLSEGYRVFSDWYAVKVPESLLKELLCNNLDMAHEVYSKGVGDTCQREALMCCLLTHMKLGCWPTYGSPEEYKNEFYKKFKETAPKFGIIVDEQAWKE